MKTILSSNQTRILDLLLNQKLITQNFYLSGGTALAEFYLLHRLSEDLDFFSFNEFESEQIFVILKKIQKEAGIIKIDFQQSFNRNLFFLHLKNDVIKSEFTFYPFAQIEPPKNYKGLSIDSITDIAVNKLFTIYQKPRSRDFIDLYLILQKEHFNIKELILKAKMKFDWHVDPLQLGSQFLQVQDLSDYPHMVVKLDQKDVENYFLNLAKDLRSDILKY